MNKTPTTLIIMDGFGLAPAADDNAVTLAKTPVLDKLFKEYAHTTLSASGLDVGLPAGQMGNSEVGHTNIGGGRVVFQDLPRISRAIEDGSFFRNEAYNKAMDDCLAKGTSLHLYGLLSDGGVHSHIEHLFALLQMAKDKGLTKVYIHCFLDGRDVPPSSGKGYIQQLQEKLAAGTVTATLVVDNQVEVDTGTTYNVTGVLKGKSSDRQILVGGHYDVHFWGFQDDNCAVGLVLSMAKALVDSGYQPENDIVFCLHGAEEWGSSYTQYDWTVGAWEMINQVHPEWVGKTLAFINFELPAYEFDTYTSTYSAPEMFSMLDYFANEYAYSPDPEGCFPDGVLTEGYQTYTYSDDFSYYAAGVPSTVNGFLLQKDMETVFPFYLDIYHSQYDTPDTYNEAVMDFNIRYYGALAMYIDQTPALYLDFTAQYDRILAAMNEPLMAESGVDTAAFQAALEELKTAAQNMIGRIKTVNNAYLQAQKRQDLETMASLRAEGAQLTDQNLKAFAYAQKHLLGLMYERPIVPHEAPQENIQLCRDIIACLETGDVATAVDEYAWTVNNVLEWYAMYFSPEVIAVQDDMLWGPDNQENLYWGTNIGFAKADVDAATRSIFARYDEVDGDFSQEIAVYQAAIQAQLQILRDLGTGEIAAMTELAQLLG